MSLFTTARSAVGVVTRHNDINIVFLLVTVIALMIIPLPTPVVDTLIGVNMALSFTILMMTMYVRTVLDFSVFPTLLLFTTLFRVGLNITTTRLILLQADAGEIIFTFGEFALGGNFVVGAVVFLILTIVQFLVIAKGAERVAEVGAHQIFVRADSRRMPMDIYLSKRTYPDVRDGEKVVVRIADWLPGSKSPVGELVERLGMAGNNDTEMHAILAEYELPYRFEPEVEQAAEDIDGRITAKEIAQRRDFRNVTTFTVDPAGAEVTIDGQTGTHTEGRWVFALPDGTYSYSVRAFGYLEKTGELTVQGGTVDESVTLAAAARRSVTFTVTPADANAAVTVLWNGQAVAPESDGSYSLPYGDYQYLIKAKGYARASADFTVDESSPADISVELTPSRAWDGAAKEAPDGAGTQAAPYQIESGEQLAWLADTVAQGSGAKICAVLTDAARTA